MSSGALLKTDPCGLYCEAGGFYVDPKRKVDRAVITHAHSDHAKRGSAHYLCSTSGEGVLRERIGKQASVQAVPFGEVIDIKGVKVSLHPAGHILGSAQVRVEHRGEVWVVSGDYKTEADPSCELFEPVRCHCFITESTFGLPIYHWRPSAEVFGEIRAWWASNRARGKTSVLHAYSLGKAQRLLRGLLGEEEPIYVHAAVDAFLPHYRAAGVEFPHTQVLGSGIPAWDVGRALIITAPGASEEVLRECAPISRAFASGWMRMRRARGWQSLDRGFELSDHVDWQEIMDTVDACGAEQVGVMHGYTDAVVRHLRARGMEAFVAD